ncbi:MAG: hypothetical protein CMN32_03955 [Saprospirales bacterium]|jgi:hypothetical protein|nr:hypothetical protein [Saprospirales bacterium]
MEDHHIYREAQRRVRQKAKFFKHLYTYVIVVGIMFFLTLFRGRPFAFVPVALFWGIAIMFHYLKVFGIPGTGILSKEWEEEEIEKEVRRMKGILGKDVDEEPEVELPDEEMKLRELRKDYDDSEFV